MVVSRGVGNSVIPIRINNRNIRQENARENLERAKELLA